MKTAWHLVLLTAITFLVNVPFFSPRLVFVHDTLDNFIYFHYTYSDVYCQGEFPRWVPWLGYGMPYDFHIFDALLPTHYVAMASGWLFGVKDALLLFKLSMFLSQLLFVLGLYALSNKLCSSRLAVWAICLGALLTNAWLHNCLLNFTIFYLLPLVLYWLLEFFETARPGYLWAAGIVEALSLLGTLSYIAPLHLLILVAFVLAYACRDSSRALLLVRWRNFVHPLFFVFAVLLALQDCLVFGMDAEIIAPGRDPLTGNVRFDEFLYFYRQPLAGMLTALTLGHLTNGDMTNYVGFLPLLTLGYGLMRRRDPAFLALLAVAFVLLWFALGGYFSRACYYGFPLMNKFRQISYAFNVLKVFVLLLGGLGFDQWLRDVRGLSGAGPTVLGKWGWLAIAALLCAFAADFCYSVRPNDLTDCWLNYCDRSFAEGPGTRFILMARYLCYAGVLGGILIAVWKRAERKLLGLLGAALLAVYVADVGAYYLAMVHYTRFVPDTVAIGDAFDVCPLTYDEQRTQFDARTPPPGRARNIVRILRAASAKPQAANDATLYASLYLLFRVDPIEPTYRLDLILPGVKRMIESVGGTVSASYTNPGIFLPHKDRFKQTLGWRLPKIRIVREAEFVGSVSEACVKLRTEENPQDRLIIVGEDGASAKPQAAIDDVRVTKYSANRIEIDVVAGAPGWLYDADAFDRGWQATIDGRRADVVRANVGCKAVPVQEGRQHVVLFFDRGLRDWVCWGVAGSAAFFGWVLIGGVLVIGWRVTGGGWRAAGEGEETSAARGPLLLWSACAIMVSVGCAFVLVPAMIGH